MSKNGSRSLQIQINTMIDIMIEENQSQSRKYLNKRIMENEFAWCKSIVLFHWFKKIDPFFWIWGRKT
jgi:hypothetical protein